MIAFGRAHLVEDAAEKRLAAQALADKYSPDESAERRDSEIEHSWNALGIIRIDVEHLTGKKAIDLVHARQETDTE